MSIHTDYSDFIVCVRMESEDASFVRRLACKFKLTTKEVCCYLYLLLLVEYTGNLSYKLCMNSGKKYVYSFCENYSIGENLKYFAKSSNTCQGGQLHLQEYETVSEEYTFWIDNKRDTMIIKMNLKNIVSTIPPYFEYHFMNCLKALSQEEIMLKEINLIPEFEQHLIRSFQGKSDLLRYRGYEWTIGQQFEKIVSEKFEKCAVEMQGYTLTYNDLNKYSNQAAVALLSNGVTSNTVVGVMITADIDLIIWILGILKIQAIYLPIDMENSITQIEHIVKECKVRHIIGTDNKDIRDLLNVHFINKNSYKQYFKDELKINSIGGINDCAYIIYTSGTTGKPKGIAVTHSNLLHQIQALKEQKLFQRYSTVLFSANVCFDVSLQQILYPLLTGGTVCILPPQMKLNSRMVIQYINERNIDIVNFVPSYLEVLLKTTTEKMKCKILLVGGEVFRKHLFELINLRVDAKYVCNIYGTSETTINATLHVCNSEEKCEIIPIGKPLLNYHTYVVNQYNKPIPLGVNGELYISGPGVAQGYINQREMTQKKFVSIDSLDSSIIYKSGDFVSWNIEGELCFVGRKDSQVKIRGKRFEVEAIENILYQYDSITSVVVIYVEEKKAKLVVFFSAEKIVTKDELENYLREYLLPYMIPVDYIQLDCMPLTDSGKVDRSFLIERWRKEGNICQR